MGWLTLSDARAQQLRHFRRRTWVLIALCFFARGADSALGLNFIEHAPLASAQDGPTCGSRSDTLC